MKRSWLDTYAYTQASNASCIVGLGGCVPAWKQAKNEIGWVPPFVEKAVDRWQVQFIAKGIDCGSKDPIRNRIGHAVGHSLRGHQQGIASWGNTGASNTLRKQFGCG